MSHASRSHDAFEQLQKIRDDMEKLSEEAQRLETKLAAEIRLKEAALAMGNAMAVLIKLNRQATITDQDRMQMRGVRKQLENVLGALKTEKAA